MPFLQRLIGRTPHRQIAVGLIALALLALSALARETASASRRAPLTFDREIPVPASAEEMFAAPLPVLPDTTAGTNCRFGAATVGSSGRNWLPTLGAGWYVDFFVTGAQVGGAEYVRTLRIREDRDAQGRYLGTVSFFPGLDAVRNLARNNPGSLWLIGNEPDRVEYQDDTRPTSYARAYHNAYYAIKGADPLAQVGIAGLVQVTPGRLQYYDIVLNTYQSVYKEPMPVDVWNAHVYVLPERNLDGSPSWAAHIALGTDPNLAMYESNGTPQMCTNPNDNIYCVAEHDNMTIFRNQVRAMRQWMKDRGQQNKPLILSEFGILFPYEVEAGGCFLMDEFGQCFTPTRVLNFLNQSKSYLDTAVDNNLGYPLDGHRMVQQWAWFPVYHRVPSPPNDPGGIGYVSNLLKPNYTSYSEGDLQALTPLGLRFREMALSQTPAPNLMIERVSTSAGPGPVGMQVTVRNNGDTAVTAPVVVSFYRDAALTDLIASTTLPAEVGGCARQSYTVSALWNISTPGIHPFWVKVDATNLIAETNENDNVGQGAVVVQPYQVWLPFVDR